MELKVINEQGQEAAKLQASDVLFGREFNEALVHQIVVAYQANARSGDSKQKDRSEVRHTTTKPWRQKGTGRARAGTIRSPIWRGGGATFAAKPQDHSQKLNKKMYRAALRSILSELVRLDRLVVVADFAVDAPKTKGLVSKLEGLGLNEWNRTLAVNLTGPMLLAKHCAPYLRAHSGASKAQAGDEVAHNVDLHHRFHRKPLRIAQG
mgnify:CR=1 FL=1